MKLHDKKEKETPHAKKLLSILLVIYDFAKRQKILIARRKIAHKSYEITRFKLRFLCTCEHERVYFYAAYLRRALLVDTK